MVLPASWSYTKPIPHHMLLSELTKSFNERARKHYMKCREDLFDSLTEEFQLVEHDDVHIPPVVLCVMCDLHSLSMVTLMWNSCKTFYQEATFPYGRIHHFETAWHVYFRKHFSLRKTSPPTTGSLVNLSLAPYSNSKKKFVIVRVFIDLYNAT